MKRIHGRLLIATGVIHLICTFLPGVFGRQFAAFSRTAFFSISEGILSFPMFGGSIDYEAFAAFWFFYAGPFIIGCGLLVDRIEKLEGRLPLYLSAFITAVTLIGSYMIPASGMTVIMIPQCVYMLARSRKPGNFRGNGS
ncbi:MAG: DUF6463 family protein [Spirochaetes bacterium]|jgi:hypothetical protein|nr:DUF6463 family protein [Spirochaetota bacterium]